MPSRAFKLAAAILSSNGDAEEAARVVGMSYRAFHTELRHYPKVIAFVNRALRPRTEAGQCLRVTPATAGVALRLQFLALVAEAIGVQLAAEWADLEDTPHRGRPAQSQILGDERNPYAPMAWGRLTPNDDEANGAHGGRASSALDRDSRPRLKRPADSRPPAAVVPRGVAIAGETTRWGRVLGHVGVRAVYEGQSATDYKRFSASDHRDAAVLYRTAANATQEPERRTQLIRAALNHEAAGADRAKATIG